MITSSGYVAQLEAELCAVCGTFVGFCQFGALALNGGGTMGVDEAACMGCGVCVSRCANEAIALRREPAKGEPLEIQRLIAEAALTDRN
jgi:MinD superfamily P-loop ATPase